MTTEYPYKDCPNSFYRDNYCACNILGSRKGAGTYQSRLFLGEPSAHELFKVVTTTEWVNKSTGKSKEQYPIIIGDQEEENPIRYEKGSKLEHNSSCDKDIGTQTNFDCFKLRGMDVKQKIPDLLKQFETYDFKKLMEFFDIDLKTDHLQ